MLPFPHMQDTKLVYSFFRSELYNIIKDELGYLLKHFDDGKEAIEETEGRLAEFMNRELRKAFIEGHKEGALAVIEDHKLPVDFIPDIDATYASRKYETWKNRQ